MSLKTSFNLEKTVEAFYTGGNTEISADGERIYCTCGDKITIIETKNGEKLSELVDDEDDVTCFTLAPDGKVLVSASKSLLLHQFDLNEAKVVRRWKAANKTNILTMVFDESSTLLATGSSDTTIKVYDTLKQYYTHSFKGSEGSVSLLKFHPDRNKLVLFSATNEGKIRMWDLNTSKCVCIFEGHFSTVTSLLFTKDLETMISSGRDKVLISWDLINRKQLKTIPVFESIEGMVKIPKSKLIEDDSVDQEYFCTAGETGCLRVWRLPDGKCMYADSQYKEKIKNCNTDSQGSNVLQLYYQDKIQKIISVTFDHNIVFYHVDSMKREKQLIGYYDEIVDLKFFGTDEKYIVIATNSEQIKVVCHSDLSSEVLFGHTATVLGLDISCDGKYIVSCSKDNSVRVWCKDDDTGKFCCVAVGLGHTHHVGAIAWSKLCTDYLISGSQDLTLKCWSLPKMLIKSETINLNVKWTEKVHEKDINAVAVSPNDKLVVSASQDKTAKVLKLKSGKHLGTLRGHKRGIWTVLFSPVDQCIVTGSADSVIKIWALSNFTCVKTLEGHSNSVLKMLFLNRGMQLISSGSDGLLKLWNIKTDECLLTLDGHEDKAWALAGKKSEDTIISGGADSTIKFWKDVTEEKLREEEEKEASILLNEQELSNLIHEKKYDVAVGLAITMDQPFRVLNIFRDMLYNEDGQEKIGKVIKNLRNDQLESLLSFMCDWNTNAKKSFVSQTVLSHILRCKHPDELLEMPRIKEIIESLLPYTERHYERVNELVQQSMFIEYTWESMKLTSLS